MSMTLTIHITDDGVLLHGSDLELENATPKEKEILNSICSSIAPYAFKIESSNNVNAATPNCCGCTGCGYCDNYDKDDGDEDDEIDYYDYDKDCCMCGSGCDEDCIHYCDGECDMDDCTAIEYNNEEKEKAKEDINEILEILSGALGELQEKLNDINDEL